MIFDKGGRAALDRGRYAAATNRCRVLGEGDELGEWGLLLSRRGGEKVVASRCDLSKQAAQPRVQNSSGRAAHGGDVREHGREEVVVGVRVVLFALALQEDLEEKVERFDVLLGLLDFGWCGDRKSVV